MDPARLDRLRKVCESSWAPDDDDAIIHILLANRDFNLAIAEASGNALLAKTIHHLQNLSLRILFLGTDRHEAATFWGSGPGKIRDAIVARNGRWRENSMRRIWRWESVGPWASSWRCRNSSPSI
jgi:DNA-binding GntR family transcriptional regulator